MLPLNQSYESAVRGYPQTVTVLGGSLARTPIEAVSEFNGSVLCKKFGDETDTHNVSKLF